MKRLIGTALFFLSMIVTVPALAGGPDDLKRGMNMQQVESALGAPAEKRAAVGQPPISSWIYDGFAVYFEYDLMLHTVRTNRACPLCEPRDQPAADQ